MPLHQVRQYRPVPDITKTREKCAGLLEKRRKSSCNVLRVGRLLQREIRNDVIKILCWIWQRLTPVIHTLEPDIQPLIRRTFHPVRLIRHRRQLSHRKHPPQLRQIRKSLHHQNPQRHLTRLQELQQLRPDLLRHISHPFHQYFSLLYHKRPSNCKSCHRRETRLS